MMTKRKSAFERMIESAITRCDYHVLRLFEHSKLSWSTKLSMSFPTINPRILKNIEMHLANIIHNRTLQTKRATLYFKTNRAFDFEAFT